MSDISLENLKDYIVFLEGLRTDSDNIVNTAIRLKQHAPDDGKQMIVALTKDQMMLISATLDIEIRRLKFEKLSRSQEEQND